MGPGASLQRRAALVYGNDPANWLTGLPSPGTNAIGGQAPQVTTQPLNLSVVGGQTATLSVAVAGTAPLRYQWEFNGSRVAAGTNATLLITNASHATKGRIRSRS